jgi:hypothetical protein
VTGNANEGFGATRRAVLLASSSYPVLPCSFNERLPPLPGDFPGVSEYFSLLTTLMRVHSKASLRLLVDG